MRKRKLLRLLALVAVAAVVFLLWPVPLPPTPSPPVPVQAARITRENFDRITYEMTRADVEALLGPAGLYATGPVNRIKETEVDVTLHSDYAPGSGPMPLRIHAEDQWCADQAWIGLSFDGHDHPDYKSWSEMERLRLPPARIPRIVRWVRSWV
jgi:hypothetical protein